MIRVLTMILVIILTGCNRQLQQYENLVDQINGVEVHYTRTDKVVRLSKQQTETFKDILTRNINPEMQRKFSNEVRVDLFKDSNRLAFLRIYEGSQQPFVNFNSDSLNFGFQSTYGIGMFVNELE